VVCQPVAQSRLDRALTPAALPGPIGQAGIAAGRETQLVKMYLKILAVIVSVSVLWLGYRYVLSSRDEGYDFETLTIDGGELTSETFVQVRGRIAQSKADKKTFIVKESAGGNGGAALAIGILLHRHNWDVEVVGLCASSCANWIFPAGKAKYLNGQSMLLFHGGPHQANWLENGIKLEQMIAANGAPVEPVELGHKNKEGVVGWTLNRSAADDEVLEFFSINKDLPGVEKLIQFRSASDKFYQELGINPLLPEYGQIGTYEPTYKSYKYGGFIYRLDSLRRLGIRNIELKQGEWHPERHPEYPNVYEVTYP
jgi:hypothetical protein